MYTNVVHRLNVLRNSMPPWYHGIRAMPVLASSAGDANKKKSSRQPRQSSSKAPPGDPTKKPKKKKPKKKKQRAAPIITYSPAELAERQGLITRSPQQQQQQQPQPPSPPPPPPPPPSPPVNPKTAAIQHPSTRKAPPPTPLPDTLAVLGIAEATLLTRLQRHGRHNNPTNADVEEVASLLKANGLGLQPLRPLLTVRPSLLLAEERAALTAQLHGITSALGGSAPTKAATAALRAMLRHDLHSGWRGLPSPDELHASLAVLQATISLSAHSAAKLGANTPAVLMDSSSTLQRRITSLHTTTGASIPVLRAAVRRAPQLLLLDDVALRVARLQSMLAARCGLSPAAVLEQVVAVEPAVLTLSAAAAGGTAGGLARALGAVGAGRLLSLAPVVLTMPCVGLMIIS